MTRKEEIRKKLTELAKLDISTIIEANEVCDLLSENYRDSKDVSDLLWGRELTWRLEEMLARSNHSVSVMARTLDRGWYTAYHYLLKIVPRDSKGVIIQSLPIEYQSGIDQLAAKINAYFLVLDSEKDPILWVSYGSLLVLIESQLKGNKDKAKEIENQEVKIK